MHSTLNILQANVLKSQGVQDALYNDPDIWDFDIILIQEPHHYNLDGRIHITGTGPNFELIKPNDSDRRDVGERVRSCIWINKKNDFRQISTNSNDITIGVLGLRGRDILIASLYIPSKGNGIRDDETEVLDRLQKIQTIITSERIGNPDLEICIAGDFNRHDSLWGGSSVATGRRQGEATKILDFIEENDLQLATPRGMITWERNEQCSTIDLILLSERLYDDRTACKVFENEHGSDHRAIHTSVDLAVTQEEFESPRYNIQKADWKAIQNHIKQTIGNEIFPTKDLDAMAQYIQSAVERALEQHCPKYRPSAFAKRWWTMDLSALRKRYTQVRNQARSRRRQGTPDAHLEAAANTAKHDFHHAIKKQKKKHWTEFLDDTTNVWKASRYLNLERGSSFGRIPAVKREDGTTTQDKAEIAETLLASFFPEPPTPQQPEQTVPSREARLLSGGITLHEIETALLATNPDRAAGADGLTTRVWRETWSVLQHLIQQLFSQSIQQGKLPAKWKVAKIIPLKKGNKDDYTAPKNYRPISLLATLGKVLEAVIAARIAYFTEIHKLLPSNHFGARKQKSTVHAISYLQESIFDAWRNKRTLSLVSFDVKGAYNNVATEPLLERLRKRRIPEPIIRWVRDFCTDRKASVVVNGFTSEVRDLPQSGLPQGSPLAPILFLFFNADLVQTAIRDGGSMAFVDDYTAWIVGESAERNTRKIQREILPELEKWEKESGAVFESSKTAFIHFTRNHDLARDSLMPLQFKRDTIQPVPAVKILGVILDQELRYKEHMANKAGKAYKAALALKRLQGLRPSSMRQLFSATVAPVMDYAAAVWYPTVSANVMAALDRAQRVAAQAIIGGFKTMALKVAVIEAGIQTVQQRLHRHILRFWIGIQKLDSSHIHARLARTKPTRRFASPLRKIAEMFKTLQAHRAEKIPAVACEPWALKPKVYILDREQAKLDTAPQQHTFDLYTDASIRNGRVGIGVWTNAWEVSRTIAREEESNVHLAELEAIWAAIGHLSHEDNRSIKIRVFSDNQGALRSILHPRSNDSIHLVSKIRQKIKKVTFSLHWVPGHEGIEGNEKANELAQKATDHNARIPRPATTVPISSIYAKAKAMDLKPRDEDFYTTNIGKHLQKIDKSLPGKHTRKMYNALSRADASILAQMRTNTSRLNSYLHKINIVDTNKCECGAIETVQHFLFLCIRWKEERQNMRAAHGSRYLDISYALGGYSIHEENGKKVDGDKDKWKPNWNAVKATIEFAKATGRLQFITQ